MNWLTPLVDAVTHYWGKTGKAFNLARAKPELTKKQVDVFGNLNGRKLKDAIQEDGSKELRLVRHPTLKLTWGLVPANIELPADISTLFERNDETVGDSANSVRFSRGVWLAFSKPMKPQYRRFLEIKVPSPAMKEIPEGQALPPFGLEVLADDIWNPNTELLPTENRDLEIERKIKQWASSKGVPLKDLSRRADEKEGEQGTVGKIYLDISNLNQSEKSRILIPLDVLEKIIFRDR